MLVFVVKKTVAFCKLVRKIRRERRVYKKE